MDEADAELTRLAVQEILQEMQIYKEREEKPIQERKINPIARTNKNFLGRTLNAMVQHNKRTDERTRKKCNKKLKELDEQRYKRSYDTKNHHARKRSHHSKDVHDVTTDSETDVKMKISQKRSKTKKKKKKRHRRSPSYCSSSSSEEQGKTNEHQEFGYNQNEYYSSNNVLEELDPSAYFMAPTLWDLQMQQFYQYKALMAFSCAAAQADSNSTVQIVELDSSSSSSLSDINLDEPTLSSSDEDKSGLLTINVTDDSTSSSSSSGGEEENAKILTINVTDDENSGEAEKSVKDVISKKVPENSSKIVNEINNPTVIIDDGDCISLHSTDSSDNETVKAAIDLTAD